MPVNPIPDGYHSVTPYLFISGAADAIAFYEKAFDATELFRLPSPDGKVMHAEIRIGNSHVMLADAMEEFDVKSPSTLGGTTGSLMIYVDDADALFQQAINAGATEAKPMEDQFWGDRMGALIDPFGHQLSIATHVEDVAEDVLAKRFEAMMKEMGPGC